MHLTRLRPGRHAACTGSLLIRILPLALIGLLVGCGGGGGGGASSPATHTPGLIAADTTLEELVVGPDETTRIAAGAVVTVEGDAVIQGVLEAIDGPLHLRVKGDLTASGTLQAVRENPPEVGRDLPLREQQSGLYIVVEGALRLEPSAVVRANGPVLMTDDVAQLAATPQMVYDEAGTADGDAPTLVPLDPDDDAFLKRQDLPPEAAARVARQVPQPLVPWHILNRKWDLLKRKGDVSIVLLHLKGRRDAIFSNVVIIGPKAPDGDDDDRGNRPGVDAQGGNGKAGMGLYIRNTGGGIDFDEGVVLTLAAGGEGGDAHSVGGTARGGHGGPSGRIRIKARTRIHIGPGGLTINPGASGAGG